MERKIKGTRALTLSAVFSALGVVLLALGSLLQVLDLTMAVLASFLVILAVIELRGRYPYLIYAVTAVLGLLLCPVKTAPVVYLCFAGYYPIIKARLEAKLPRVLCWIIKIVIFNAGLALALFLSVKIFTVLVVPAVWYYFLLPLLTGVFILYDIALTRVITAYVLRWRQRFTFLHK